MPRPNHPIVRPHGHPGDPCHLGSSKAFDPEAVSDAGINPAAIDPTFDQSGDRLKAPAHGGS